MIVARKDPRELAAALAKIGAFQELVKDAAAGRKRLRRHTRGRRQKGALEAGRRKDNGVTGTAQPV